MVDFAKKLKEIRMEKGYSQKETSLKLGMSKNAYSNYEMGIREPSLDTLKKICQLFDTSSDYLIGLKD